MNWRNVEKNSRTKLLHNHSYRNQLLLNVALRPSFVFHIHALYCVCSIKNFKCCTVEVRFVMTWWCSVVVAIYNNRKSSCMLSNTQLFIFTWQHAVWVVLRSRPYEYEVPRFYPRAFFCLMPHHDACRPSFGKCVCFNNKWENNIRRQRKDLFQSLSWKSRILHLLNLYKFNFFVISSLFKFTFGSYLFLLTVLCLYGDLATCSTPI